MQYFDRWLEIVRTLHTPGILTAAEDVMGQVTPSDGREDGLIMKFMSDPANLCSLPWDDPDLKRCWSNIDEAIEMVLLLGTWPRTVPHLERDAYVSGIAAYRYLRLPDTSSANCVGLAFVAVAWGVLRNGDAKTTLLLCELYDTMLTVFDHHYWRRQEINRTTKEREQDEINRYCDEILAKFVASLAVLLKLAIRADNTTIDYTAVLLDIRKHADMLGWPVEQLEEWIVQLAQLVSHAE